MKSFKSQVTEKERKWNSLIIQFRLPLQKMGKKDPKSNRNLGFSRETTCFKRCHYRWERSKFLINFHNYPRTNSGCGKFYNLEWGKRKCFMEIDSEHYILQTEFKKARLFILTRKMSCCTKVIDLLFTWIYYKNEQFKKSHNQLRSSNIWYVYINI